MLWRDTQVLAMAVMFLTGAGLALFFDLCAIISGRAQIAKRARRRAHGRRRLSFWDVALWLVATPLVFVATVISNRGELRIYVFVGLALGVAAYALLARNVVVTVGVGVRTALVVAAGTTARWCSRWIGRPVMAAGAGLGRASRAAARWGWGRTQACGRGLGRVAGGLGSAARGFGSGAGLLGRRILGGFRGRPKE